MSATLTPFLLFGLTGALLIGLSFYSLVAQSDVLRKILAWNVLGSGIFLILGAVSIRNSGSWGADPLPQAIVITGIVVAISSTALAIALTRIVRADLVDQQENPQEIQETQEKPWSSS